MSSVLRNEALQDGYPSVKFVDMARCRDSLLLLAYLNRAYSYTKLQLYLDSNDRNSFKSVLMRGKKLQNITVIKSCVGM